MAGRERGEGERGNRGKRTGEIDRKVGEVGRNRMTEGQKSGEIGGVKLGGSGTGGGGN